MFGSVSNLSLTAAFTPRQPFFPSCFGFSVRLFPPCLPFLVPSRSPGGAVDTKSRRVIYGGFGCFLYRLDIYGNSNHHKNRGFPREGASEGVKEKQSCCTGGDSFSLSRREQNFWRRRCRPVCGSWSVCKETRFQKEPVCVSEMLPKRVVSSVLTQIHKLEDLMLDFI